MLLLLFIHIFFSFEKSNEIKNFLISNDLNYQRSTIEKSNFLSVFNNGYFLYKQIQILIEKNISEDSFLLDITDKVLKNCPNQKEYFQIIKLDIDNIKVRCDIAKSVISSYLFFRKNNNYNFTQDNNNYIDFINNPILFNSLTNMLFKKLKEKYSNEFPPYRFFIQTGNQYYTSEVIKYIMSRCIFFIELFYLFDEINNHFIKNKTGFFPNKFELINTNRNEIKPYRNKNQLYFITNKNDTITSDEVIKNKDKYNYKKVYFKFYLLNLYENILNKIVEPMYKKFNELD